MRYLVKRHDILALFALSFCSCIFVGCHNRPVDTSQKILIESAKALSSIDTVVARNISKASDESIEYAKREVMTSKVALSQCVSSFGEDCSVEVPDPMTLYRERMETWNRLTVQLEVAAELFKVWDRANVVWRESGKRPVDWQETICEPLEGVMDSIDRLLDILGFEIPELWGPFIDLIPQVCVVTTNAVDVSLREANE